MEAMWMIWGIGFGTGAVATYLGCILFCRRLLKEEGELVAFFERKKGRQMEESALDSVLQEWERQLERKKYGTDL